MLLITPDVISAFNIYSVCDYRTVQRAQNLVNAQRVKVVSYSLDQAVCRVNEKEDVYTVHIKLVSKKQFSFNCPCEQFDSHSLCKHVPAALMALNQYLYGQSEKDWQYRLANVLQTMPRRATASKRQKYAVMFGLHKESFYDSSRYSLVPYSLKNSPWGELDSFGDDPEDFYRKLAQDLNWQRYVDTPYQSLNAEGCVNLPGEGVVITNLLLQARRNYFDTTVFTTYLPLLAKLDAPVFLVEKQKFRRRLTILPDPVEIQAALGRGQD
ncbi:MAG: hypothetical protein IH586_02835, partial [Anaerolineaceae bacterium]|nr:hypothetical protein [Anaerolineaceae bacterium]